MAKSKKRKTKAVRRRKTVVRKPTAKRKAPAKKKTAKARKPVRRKAVRPPPRKAGLARRARPLPDIVDEASLESFPASDPPSWTPVTGEDR